MSLGITSLWRARSRCVGITGLPLISRVPTPSRISRPASSALTMPLLPRALSTTTASATTDSPARTSASTNPLEPTKSLSGTLSPAAVGATLASQNDSTLLPEGNWSDIALESQSSRKRFYEEAFTSTDSSIAALIAQKRSSPLVTPARQYPNEAATKKGLELNLREARRQVGYEIVQSHFGKQMPRWVDCFHILKRMTPQWSERTNMAAVRVVLPDNIDLSINNKNIEYVDSATGLLMKLRSSVDRNPFAIVLRGQSSVIAKAADEIVRSYPEAKVYKLGEVATSDYKTKRLWPTIEDAPNGGESVPDDKMDNIWLHKEYQPHHIMVPYEKVPKPEAWTQDSFESYVATLVYGCIPSHLAIPFYGQRRRDGRLVDTDGIRVKLIAEAFEDPAARPFITASVLKMAISLMAFKGGHRATGRRLMKLAEEWGVPMDADTFNVILEGYCRKGDVAFFYHCLRDMEVRYFHPNIRTWLLFLQFTKTEDERRQVILAMYELGMFHHSATRRGIAEVMASDDAYSALKAGKSLDVFLEDETARYSPDWVSVGAVNSIIRELLRFDRDKDPRVKDAMRLVDKQTKADLKIDASTINLFLEHAAANRDWDTALWAVSLFGSHGCEPDQLSYQHLTALAVRTCFPHALGVVFFYSVLDRKVRTTSRDILRRVLLRRHHLPFWAQHQPFICPKDLLLPLQKNKVTSKTVMSHIERTILEKWNGWTPVQSLEKALTIARRSFDVPLQAKVNAGKPVERDVVILKLRNPAAAATTETASSPMPTRTTEFVRLNGWFDPEKMLKSWTRPEE